MAPETERREEKAMTITETERAPRRVRVPGDQNRNIYRRPDGAFEIGYRDSTGRQRWKVVAGGITAARGERDAILGAKARGERVQPNPKLRFGEAVEKWLAEQVADLRPGTRSRYESDVRLHVLPRWGQRRMDAIDVGEAAQLVRELRAAGLAEWTIQGVLVAAGRVFRFARRRMGWTGQSPIALLENGERPRLGDTPEPRIYQGDELAQVLAASWEPWTTLFRLTSVVGPRESESLGLWWENLWLDDLDAATIAFTHQVDRRGTRVPLKTDESKAVLPLPRSAAVMMLEHKARTAAPDGPRAFVFATGSGRPLGQRNVLRALYTAQERARRRDGTPTFPELFEHDERGHLVVDDEGHYVPNGLPRRELPPLPDFHALRHTAAMDCEDAEEARDLLRHKNSNVTRAVYRRHFGDRRRELLRARMEARHGSTVAAEPSADRAGGEVVPLEQAS
jgi:integrase